MITRRRFVQGAGVAGLGLLAGCGQRLFEGQPPRPKVPTLGYLNSSRPDSGDSPDSPEARLVPQVSALLEGLAALGYAEGHNLVIQYRFAGGSEAELREAAAELVRLPVDIIVTTGNPATFAAKGATSTIPIVFTGAPDPVGQGQAASLARPGGNLTGLTTLNTQLGGQQLELLAQAVPGLRRVAILRDPGAPANLDLGREPQAAAPALGLELLMLDVRDPADLEAAFAVASTEQAGALFARGDWATRHRAQIVSLAARSRLPAMYTNSLAVQEGGLMAYAANVLDLHRRAAAYVDKILKGVKPADLPIEQPMRFDFVINLKTAQALGLTIPPHVLLQATEVIR